MFHDKGAFQLPVKATSDLIAGPAHPCRAGGRWEQGRLEVKPVLLYAVHSSRPRERRPGVSDFWFLAWAALCFHPMGLLPLWAGRAARAPRDQLSFLKPLEAPAEKAAY